MTFTPEQQAEHRKAYIDECHRKAWGATCHADFIGKQLDDAMAHYKKLSDELATITAKIKTLKAAPDNHTKENRDERKKLDADRQTLIRSMQAITKNANDGHQAMAQLHANAGQNLALARHAEGWEWAENGAPI